VARPGKSRNDNDLTITVGALNTSSVNHVNCVLVQTGQTLYRISKETGVSLRQLYKYNDFEEGKEVLQTGEIVYLQPKRMKSSNKKQITVKESNTSLRQISQQEGVRLKALMRKNKIADADAVLPTKTKIKL
jgi:LysM repeat protein